MRFPPKQLPDVIPSDSDIPNQKNTRPVFSFDLYFGSRTYLTDQEISMKRVALGFTLIGALLVGALPVLAHHSFAAEFDASKPVTLTGTVTKIDWTNPHVWFFINVKDEKTGQITNWGAEMGPPHLLQGQGWTRTTMKLGDSVTVNGTLAKNGAPRLNARSVVNAEGKKLGAASSEGQAQP